MRYSDFFPTDETDLQNVSTRVTYDDTPIQEYMNEVIKLLQLHTTITFTDLLKGIDERIRIIGFFVLAGVSSITHR